MLGLVVIFSVLRNSETPEISGRQPIRPEKTTQSHADHTTAKLEKENGSPVVATEGKSELRQVSFRVLEAMPEGDAKEEMAMQLAGTTNRSSAAILLEVVTTSNDRAAFRAAATALTHMADDELVREMVARCDSTPDEEVRLRLAEIIGGIDNEAAIDGLIWLTDGKDRSPSDPLMAAAVEGLGRIGTPHAANYLVQRLDSAPQKAATQIAQSLAQMESPEARAAIRSAAQGNKDVTTDAQRIAAIRALRNHPDEEAVSALTALAGDSSQLVKAAAEEALATITGKSSESATEAETDTHAIQ